MKGASGQARFPFPVLAVLLGFLASASPLSAWRPIVRVYPAMIARADAIDDSRLILEKYPQS